jgi:hypothetical protein
MSDNSFERILQEIHHQKTYLEALQAENAELRRQLADLRSGRGIFVEIAGKRFALIDNTTSAVEDAPTTFMTTLNEHPQTNDEFIADSFLNDALFPTTDEFEQSAYAQAESEGYALDQAEVSTFLEEILVDEFTAAATLTMPMSTNSPAAQPAETSNASRIDENEKEALRKELVGSFLLE